VTCRSGDEIDLTPAAALSGSSYSFYNKYLDKNRTYIYKVIAFDEGGMIVGESNEKSI